MKVFGIGFHKTGTSTLEVVLSKLGFKILGTRIKLVKELKSKNYEKIFNLVSKYDGVQDNPWPLLFKELDIQFPDSKFILTVRDENKWIKSVSTHFGNTDTEMREFIYGVGHPKGNESIYLDRYRKHNQEVLEYFKDRKDDLLIVSWENGDSWDKICNFLGLAVPNEPFPHANKGTTSKSHLFVKVKNLLKRKLGI